MPKVARNTRRQGQRKGQVAALAAKHHVSARWLRLIAFGTLDDAAFVQAIREAGEAPHLWELVAPSALDALVIPTSKMEQLGGSLDDLLGRLLEVLQDARNRLSDRPPGAALARVNAELDLGLEFRRDADADRGRRSLKGTDHAHRVKTDKADTSARALHDEVKARISGPESTVHRSIARRILKKRRNKLTAAAIKKQTAAVKKKIWRFRERHPSENRKD